MWKWLCLPLMLLAASGCSPATSPKFTTGDIVVVESEAEKPTLADAPVGLIVEVNVAGAAWSYTVAYQGYTADFNESAGIRKVGHLDWSQLRCLGEVPIIHRTAPSPTFETPPPALEKDHSA